MNIHTPITYIQQLTFYYTCFLTFIHPINHLIFFHGFQSKLQVMIYFPINTSACKSFTGVRYLFRFCIFWLKKEKLIYNEIQVLSTHLLSSDKYIYTGGLLFKFKFFSFVKTVRTLFPCLYHLIHRCGDMVQCLLRNAFKDHFRGKKTKRLPDDHKGNVVTCKPSV